MDFLKKLARNLFYGIFVLGFVWISAQLFLERQTNNLLTSVFDYFESDQGLENQLKVLRVVYPDVPQSLEPTFNDPVIRQRINNIYEPLLRTDRDLTMRPALALSWGLTNERTWDIKLRPKVVFHDGSTFDAQDVVASINRAKKFKGSQLANILASIDKVVIVDDLNIKIKTFEPDSLLLQRLSSVLIIPSEYENEKDLSPVGTGSYRFVSWDEKRTIKLEKFNDYWGPVAKFLEVDMLAEPNKNKRVGMFLKGDADFLAFVPFDAVSVVEDKGFKIVGMPSLEVQFLLFNMDSKSLNDVENRKIVSWAIDQGTLAESLGEYAHPVSQFVSNGVFGFNPDIPSHKYDIDKALSLVEESGLKGNTLTFHIPKGLTALGEHVRKQLSGIGVNVVVSYLDPEDFFASLNEKKADIYFLGFRADLGDSGDFLDALVHTGAEFNVANYSNENVDILIERSLKEMDHAVRIVDLQEAMRVLIVDDVLGVPLFEYETLFSFSDKLDFKPRVDGFIYFDELILK